MTCYMTEAALQISRGKDGLFNKWCWHNYPYGNITDMDVTSHHMQKKKKPANKLRPMCESTTLKL